MLLTVADLGRRLGFGNRSNQYHTHASMVSDKSSFRMGLGFFTGFSSTCSICSEIWYWQRFALR